MNKPKFLFSTAVLFAFFLSGLSGVYAQQEARSGSSYEVIFQTLIATNDANRGKKIPANLTDTISKLNGTFSFSEYRLIATHLQRVADAGNISYKSLLDELSLEKGDTIFSSWSLSDLESFSGSGGTNLIGFKSFRFDARVPITTNTLQPDGKTLSVTNYESIGIGLQQFNVPENKPTLIGTLAMPKRDEVIFFVLTVKPT